MKYNQPHGVSDADAPYIDGDPTISQEGSIPPAASIEHPQREIVNFIGKSGLIPNESDLYQLTQGARSQFVNFCVDTGSANQLSVALDPPLASYRQGMPLRVLVAANNTGNSTIQVAGLGLRPIIRSSGAPLQVGDLKAGMIALLVDDGVKFQMVNYQGIDNTSITNTTTIVDIAYSADTGTPNAVIANSFGPSPPTSVTAPAIGDVILVRVGFRNTGSVTIKVGALTAISMTRNDGQALRSGDLIPGEIILLVKQASTWQMMHLVNSQVWVKLTQDLTLWVNPTGNDETGDGSTTSPFKTIQVAIDFVADNFLIAGRSVTIVLQVQGIYEGLIRISNCPGTINITTNTTAAPANLPYRGHPSKIPFYIVRAPFPVPATEKSLFVATGSGTQVNITGITFESTSTKNYVIEANYGASLSLSNIGVRGVYVPAIIVAYAGTIIIANEIHIYSGGTYCISVGATGTLTSGQWNTVFNTHSVDFDGAFLNARALGMAQFNPPFTRPDGEPGGCHFYAAGTNGRRYILQLNSVCYVSNNQLDFLPGNAAGIVDASSVYGSGE